MTKKIDISIIVPIYNVEKYLHRCIESILKQTFENIEIILVNDGSTDNSYKICEEFALFDKRIKVANQENGGLSSARNKGLELSSGKYVVFIDSDDWLEEDYCLKLFNSIEENKSDLAFCNYFIDYTNENYTIKKKIENSNERIDFNNISSVIYSLDKNGMFNVVWNKIYLNEIIRNYNISFDINGMPGEDLLFNCNYFKHIKKVSYCNFYLYHYMRQDEETLTSKYYSNLLDKIEKFNSARKELYFLYNMNDFKYQKIYQETVIGYYFSVIANIYKSNCSRKQKIDTLTKIKKNENLNSYLIHYYPKSITNWIFKNSCMFKSSFVSHFYLSVLFLIRTKFVKIYLYIRKYFLH